MSRDNLIAVGGGLLCALLLFSMNTATPGAGLLAFLSQLPLFLVGLSLGWIPAVIACVVALAAIAMGTSLASAALVAVSSIGPVLMLVNRALQSRPGPRAGAVEWYPPGLMLAWLTGYVLVMFAVAALVLSGTHGGIENAVRASLETMLSRLSTHAPDPAMQERIGAVVRYFPALFAFTCVTMLVVNAVLAQGVLSQLKRNLRPSPRFTGLELPRWMTVALAVALVASLLPGRIGTMGQNASMILALPFFFLGLAVIHALSYRVRARNALLIAVYIILLILFDRAAIVVAGLGVIEHWVLLRQRFAPPPQDQEDE